MKVQLRTYNYRFPKLDLWLDGTATFDEQGNMTVTNSTGNVLLSNATPLLVKWLTNRRDHITKLKEPWFRVSPEPEMSLQEMYEKVFQNT